MRFIRLLFSKYKYLVYTAFGNKSYMKVASRLKTAGIPFQTEIIRNSNTYQAIVHNDKAYYDIYVKEEDKHKAQEVIHQRFE
ncbi:hypothetical protein [Alkalihalobacterium chitinilyticum]|uniref:DUF2007 domain-containing protein n=1 Tax=Alkalihalobacterium chitinilyticum TaxID=2980103 RepID=A0ABT5VDJ0_9BACI|nr:hypothetical protein [Alkalihalobacterium chitinilyticum]MDE5413221.1 hypothetical protein [Alkalihalobacterium chitinilyticum]